MRHLKLLVSILLTTSISFAQTNEINLQKYWKLRNDLREDFTKIGSDPGESLPARSIRPLDCWDNINNDGTNCGWFHYGDGMIRHGYYLGLLATEYRLLKDAGEDVTGTLNELYFAIQAVNRLDFKAEDVLGDNYGVDFDPDLNGFYLREDIPENFVQANWGNSRIEARCSDSPMYKTNNAAHLDDGSDDGQGYWALENSYQNVPSLDQFSSLMLGFSLIHKLVDNVFVLPQGEPEPSGIYLITETSNIVDRMMYYIESRNWMMIDVNGWPVANQGGDCVIASYPLYEAAKRITGHEYNYPANRNQVSFHLNDVQYCLTGFGIDGNSAMGQTIACANIGFFDFAQNQALEELEDGAVAGENNNQNYSTYLSWLDTASMVFNPTEEVREVWRNDGAIALANYFQEHGGNTYTGVLLANLGVTSGVWTQERLHSFIQNTGNKELYLINAVLRDDTPYHSQSIYKGYIDNMGAAGPFNLTTHLEGTEGLKKTAANGWGSDLRWTQDNEVNGNFAEPGIFNGIDYMLFHNLYYLIYKNSLPKFNTQQDCLCEIIQPLTGTSYPGATPANYVAARDRVNQKITYINSCNENAFESVNNNVSGIFNLQPYFPEYTSWKIFPAKFLTTNGIITSTGTVNSRTLFKLCNGKTLTIQNGGKLEIQHSQVQIGLTAAIDNSGTITAKFGTTLSIWGKLILRNTGKLIIEDGATVVIEESTTALLEYFNGGQIIMNGPNSKLIIKGGIKIKDLANFQIIQNGTTCGKVIVGSQLAGLTTDNTNATFTFTGSGKNTPYMTIEKNAKLWVMNAMAKKFTLANANVLFEEGAALRCDQPFTLTNSKLTSSANNVGVLLSEGSYFSGSDLTNVPITADMLTEDIGLMEAYNCNFKTDLLSLTTPYVVKVVNRGFKFQGTNIQGVKDYCLYSNYLSLVSTIDGAVSLGYNGTSLPATSNIIGFYDYSNVEIIVKNTSVRNCNVGFKKRQGKMTLRCSTFENNRDLNINPTDGCVLNMNTTQLGGFNQLRKTTNNKNIYLGGAGYPNIKDGYNLIEYIDNQTIVGTIGTYCSTCPSLDVTKNQWLSNGSTPTNIGVVGTYIYGYSYAWVKSPVASWQLCSTGLPGESGKSGDENGMELPLIYSNIENDSISLDDAIYMATEYMSLYNDSMPDDIRSIQRLDEIFNVGLNKNDSLIYNWLWFAFDQMKAAIESAFSNNLLSKEDNTIEFDNATSMYVNALGQMSDQEIDENNYTKQFYHELNKAHLLRLVGHINIGIDILNELENCGLDSTEQEQLNHWKAVYLTEYTLQESNTSSFDTIVSPDTTNFLNPGLVINNYSFGAIIDNINAIQYPNCDFYNTKSLIKPISKFQFTIFPNPADEMLIVSIDSDKQGNSLLTFSSADGRTISSSKVNLEMKTEYSFDISTWSPGIYFITVTDSDNKPITKRFVVK